MYMREPKKQIDMLRDIINELQTTIVKIAKDQENLSRQLEWRDKWVYGIGIAVAAPIILLIVMNGIASTPKNIPVIVPNAQVK
jgi:hypothetical protein